MSWFKDLLDEDRLEFKPPFQRNPVWLAKHKAYLVDTVLRGLPVPEVYLEADTDTNGRTTYSVVDGQQRIRTLLEFGRGEVELMDDYSPGREGDAWASLSDDEKRKFWDYKLQTREIFDASEADLRDLFRRLNQHSITLNAQELRKARFKGDFIATVTELADESFWAESGIVKPREIRRMLDIEFMAELLVGIMHGPQNKKVGLDEMFQSYEEAIPEKQKWLTRFEAARARTAELVPDLRNSRWSGRSDYYSLFLAIASLQRARTSGKVQVVGARRALEKFGAAVTVRLSKAGASAPAKIAVRRYATAVEKAASDKDRRASRHAVLVELLQPYFK